MSEDTEPLAELATLATPAPVKKDTVLVFEILPSPGKCGADRG
jgi:hypothetical protein